jgi:hypothetical protein
MNLLRRLTVDGYGGLLINFNVGIYHPQYHTRAKKTKEFITVNFLQHCTCTADFVLCCYHFIQYRDSYIYAAGNDTDEVLKFIEWLPSFQVWNSVLLYFFVT